APGQLRQRNPQWAPVGIDLNAPLGQLRNRAGYPAPFFQLSQPQTGSRLGGRGDARDPAARIGFYQHELNRLPFAQYLSRVVNELLADLGKKHNCRQLPGADLYELLARFNVVDHPAQQLAWLIPCADDWRRSVPAPGRRRGAPTYRRLRRQVSKNDIPRAHASPAT